MIYQHHSGDFNLMRRYRRLELTLETNGWRGNVEQIISQEMKASEIERIDLYGDDYKSRGDQNTYYEEQEEENEEQYHSEVNGEFDQADEGKSQLDYNQEYFDAKNAGGDAK